LNYFAGAGAAFLGAAFLAAFLGAAFLAAFFGAAFLAAAFLVAFLGAAFLAAFLVAFFGAAFLAAFLAAGFLAAAFFGAAFLVAFFAMVFLVLKNCFDEVKKNSRLKKIRCLYFFNTILLIRLLRCFRNTKKMSEIAIFFILCFDCLKKQMFVNC
jgi:hypothetical protein